METSSEIYSLAKCLATDTIHSVKAGVHTGMKNPMGLEGFINE